MNIIYGIMVFGMFAYTVGYGFTLWKDKNKKGALGVFWIACMIAVIPFFTLYR
ncbi:hypothetical protein IM538_06245 [Cytobacillus suaedae]|nr:hypothetical protein IM538_06245 [Cytobacillus suaedae]